MINEEPRSATITVISAHAKCLKMTKMKFDEILSLTKMFQVGSRSSLSEGITEKVALFKSLSAATRTKLLESMSKMSFSPGTYICRQVQCVRTNAAYIRFSSAVEDSPLFRVVLIMLLHSLLQIIYAAIHFIYLHIVY